MGQLEKMYYKVDIFFFPNLTKHTRQAYFAHKEKE